MTRGRLIFIALLIALIYSAPQWMGRDAAESTAQAEPERSSIVRSLRDSITASSGSPANTEGLQRTIRNAERDLGPLSPEQRALFDDLRAARDSKRKLAALDGLTQSLEQTKKQSVSFYEWAADGLAYVQDFYRTIQPRARSALWFIAVLLVALGVVAALLSQTHLARLSARLGFRFSRGWLVILSFVAMALAMGTRTNPWPSFPTELVLPPLVALIGCGFALRLVDFNYPIWNSLVRGCGAPLISMAFIATYLKLI